MIDISFVASVDQKLSKKIYDSSFACHQTFLLNATKLARIFPPNGGCSMLANSSKQAQKKLKFLIRALLYSKPYLNKEQLLTLFYKGSRIYVVTRGGGAQGLVLAVAQPKIGGAWAHLSPSQKQLLYLT